MKIINLEKKELSKFLYDDSIIIGKGSSNGIVSIYDDTTLAKIHFKDIRNSYYSKNLSFVDDEIAKVKSFDRKMEKLGLNKLSILKRLITQLNNSHSPLIKGIIMYKDYPIGILMEYYIGYEKLNEYITQLDSNSVIIVEEKIKFLLYDLINNEIYPRDIKYDNILINKDTLDVKIIDLDDQETVVGNRAHARENSIESIERFLSKIKDYTENNIESKKMW